MDSGATHNFVAPQVITALNIPMDPTKRFGVRLGDGHMIVTRGKCTGLPLLVGDNDITVDAYVLDLGGVDMILGVAWLATLGKVEMDWGAMTVSFKSKGATVRLLV